MSDNAVKIGWIWIAVSVAGEVVGDVFVKRLSASGKWLDAAATLLAYNAMLLAWMLAIRQFRQITVPGMVWLLCGQAAVVALGVGIFHEHLTTYQGAGVALSIVAVALLCL